MEMSYLWGSVLVGIGATLLMDVWGVIQRRVFKTTSLDFCLVGRWLLYMPEGQFRHPHIARAEPKPAECAVGWAAHYLIGVAFAFVPVIATAGQWLEQPTLAIALWVGIGTVLFPLLVMQPLLGLGFAASRTPNPTQARLKSLLTHTLFGLWLYVAALPVSFWLMSQAG
ncbi:DUF2938 domain-containing protein [Marinobacter sp. SS21]|uniref:DUF2938 domain-containing protein n=1 Tax=Marinobacter sp. SS21 TaxID=2979460 RepID=UPI00232BE728|nr:DUF2938 domain-containing protein [Marinobacter sp. SS21]MDC0661471.1 DUF2938 domain-containing protein [Marinobacter sp. SS21]